MIQRATRKRLKIRNLTRNPDFSVRLSIFQVFRSCSNQNTRSTFLYFILRKIPNPSKSKGKMGVGCSERCSLDQLSFSHCF